MITPQTNSTLPQIAQALLVHESFVICGHVSPDGDCIGSQLALANALESLGRRAVCVLASPDSPDSAFDFLPGREKMVPAASVTDAFDAFVAVDVPTLERMGEGARLHERSAFTVTVDHHASPEGVSDLNYIDPDAPSATMLVWELAGHLGAPRTAELATCAYTGLMTDTGRFQYQNATADAFSAAAQMVAAGADAARISREVYQHRSYASVLLEARAIERVRLLCDGQAAVSWLSQEDFAECDANKSDAEPLIDLLRSLSGVRVACMLREQDDCVRGSFRSKDDTDVAALARKFGGGGHVAAAGFTIEASLPQASERVVRLLNERLGARGGEES